MRIIIIDEINNRLEEIIIPSGHTVMEIYRMLIQFLKLKKIITE